MESESSDPRNLSTSTLPTWAATAAVAGRPATAISGARRSFHPLTNVIAYSDSLLRFGPFSWLWRFAGASPDLAFGLWMTSMTVLNYAAGLLLFGRGLGFGAPATVAAASLLAFGAPRGNQIEHQLWFRLPPPSDGRVPDHRLDVRRRARRAGWRPVPQPLA